MLGYLIMKSYAGAIVQYLHSCTIVQLAVCNVMQTHGAELVEKSILAPGLRIESHLLHACPQDYA
jgi:hypothetical protein